MSVKFSLEVVDTRTQSQAKSAEMEDEEEKNKKRALSRVSGEEEPGPTEASATIDSAPPSAGPPPKRVCFRQETDVKYVEKWNDKEIQPDAPGISAEGSRDAEDGDWDNRYSRDEVNSLRLGPSRASSLTADHKRPEGGCTYTYNLCVYRCIFRMCKDVYGQAVTYRPCPSMSLYLCSLWQEWMRRTCDGQVLHRSDATSQAALLSVFARAD